MGVTEEKKGKGKTQLYFNCFNLKNRRAKSEIS